ncbi:hypothetical protein FIBSPDRAFT_854563, partial [Athelia psychrophila]
MGFNHMACECGAHICWVCMGIFDTNSVYEHLRTAHGGLYEADRNGAELPFQGADFQVAEQLEALRLIALRRAQLAQQQFHEAEDAQHRHAQRLLYPMQVDPEDRARTAEFHRRVEDIRRAQQEAEDERDRLTRAHQLLQDLEEGIRVGTAELHRRAENIRREEQERIRREAVEQQQKDAVGDWGCVM